MKEPTLKARTLFHGAPGTHEMRKAWALMNDVVLAEKGTWDKFCGKRETFSYAHFIDHAEFWRRGRDLIYCTSQPYDLDIKEMDKAAAAFGLKYTVNSRTLSWYYPHATYLVIWEKAGDGNGKT